MRNCATLNANRYKDLGLEQFCLSFRHVRSLNRNKYLIPRKEIHLHWLCEPIWKLDIKLITNEFQMFILMF